LWTCFVSFLQLRFWDKELWGIKWHIEEGAPPILIVGVWNLGLTHFQTMNLETSNRFNSLVYYNIWTLDFMVWNYHNLHLSSSWSTTQVKGLSRISLTSWQKLTIFNGRNFFKVQLEGTLSNIIFSSTIFFNLYFVSYNARWVSWTK
jgi:hypothetical protein